MYLYNFFLKLNVLSGVDASDSTSELKTLYFNTSLIVLKSQIGDPFIQLSRSAYVFRACLVCTCISKFSFVISYLIKRLDWFRQLSYRYVRLRNQYLDGCFKNKNKMVNCWTKIVILYLKTSIKEFQTGLQTFIYV